MFGFSVTFKRVLVNKFSRFYKNNHSLFSNMAESLFMQQKLMGVVKSFVPIMSNSMYKGQCGRIGVLGGCQEYTGAPYFAAISALKVGADLSHVFCTEGAAPVIKSYSPELIVHPLLDRSSGVAEISEWLPRIHALVIGPGLGRDPKLFDNVKGVIRKASELKIPLVIDADGIHILSTDLEIIKGNKKAILTPNFIECSRLFEKVFAEKLSKAKLEKSIPALAVALDGVTIVCKGKEDIISNGQTTVLCANEGSVRRCGGQGDLLSGSMGTFAYWAHLAVNTEKREKVFMAEELGPTIASAYGACFLTRECNRIAFTKHKRSMTTSDMITCISQVFQQHFENEECKL